MRILVAGAEGRTGTQVAEVARGHGHDVTLLMGTPDRRTLADLVRGQDAVVSTLVVDGGRTRAAIQDLSADLVRAMVAQGIERLVVASWAGAGDHLADLTMMRRAASILTGEDAGVADVVEGDVMLSELDWSIVRVHGVSDRARTGHYRVVEGPVVPKGASLPRSDLAAFLVKTAESRRYIRRIVAVAR